MLGKFYERMEKLLGEDYPLFCEAMERKAERGVRVNTRYLSAKSFSDSARFNLSPLSYAEYGFILEDELQIGNTPEHHSGMIYMQDPGAMATVCAAEIPKGAWVADLCAAPGGKSSQISALIGDEGFLLSNEFVPKRAHILVSNFERLGVRNAMVSSLDTAEIARLFSGVFDFVLVDAPCSGEGMLRKYDAASEEWSEENVLASAKRQREILDNAKALVKSGGYLIYSTCTYSEEENEGTVCDFLSKNPEFSLCEVTPEIKAITAPGILREDRPCEIERARRFYPHKARGEGQFLALLRRDGADAEGEILYKSQEKPIDKQSLLAIESFFSENLTDRPKGRLVKIGENPVLIPHGCPIMPRSVFMPGVLLGEIRQGVLHPSHHFVKTYGELFKRRERLDMGDERLSAFIGGEVIEAKGCEGKGYVAVFFGEAPLGLGKLSSGMIKNHYPKGLRTKNII